MCEQIEVKPCCKNCINDKKCYPKRTKQLNTKCIRWVDGRWDYKNFVPKHIPKG